MERTLTQKREIKLTQESEREKFTKRVYGKKKGGVFNQIEKGD